MDPALVINHEKLFELVKTDEEIRRFLHLNSVSLKLLKRHLRVLASNLGEKNKYANQITKLQSLQVKAKRRLQTTVGGGGLAGPKRKKQKNKNNRSDRIQWIDLKSAFRSRIRTGAVINLTHKLPDSFLPDAMCLVKRRFQHLMKTNQNFKFNFELSCRYELERTGEIDDKFFHTPNILLTPSTDLDHELNDCIETLKTKVSLSLSLSLYIVSYFSC